MSAHVVVIATDLRRTTVKVSPGTYLTDVLEEACRKLNLSHDKYIIKNKQKQVDLSVPFRTSGLIPGAKLELVQKSNTPSAVQVALQVPLPDGKEIPGGRLIRKFPSDLTLWKVLRQLEAGEAERGRNINITARGVAQTAGGAGASGGGQLYYESPVLNIMGRELSSFADFQKTLSQLGYNSGSVLIRMSYRQSDQTLYDAMAQMNQYFNDDEQKTQVPPVEEKAATDKAHPLADPPAEDTSMLDAQPEPPQPVPSNPAPDKAPDSVTKEADSSDNRDIYKPVNVYLAPSGAAPAAAAAPATEADFTPTASHAQLHQARLQENARNKRLLSDKELDEKAAAEEARIAAVTSVIVKVRFPDNTSSDWQVGPAETGAFLYEAVRRVMGAADQPFRLVLPVGQAVIKDDASPRNSLIRAYKLYNRVLVSLVWDDSVPADVRKRPFLKSNVAQQGQEVKVPDIPAAEEEKAAAQPALKPQTSDKGQGSGDGAAKKIPKWLKLGKK